MAWIELDSRIHYLCDTPIVSECFFKSIVLLLFNPGAHPKRLCDKRATKRTSLLVATNSARSLIDEL